ncbi:MAG: GNAT family N-acetyltransferase [Proteobacteria bacterium]|nr:GNAT family N-acetyltransferase [Pseudomonadota bacterium]
MSSDLAAPEIVDLATAGDGELARLYRLTSAIARELAPDDPPIALQASMAAWRHRNPFLRRRDWIVRDTSSRIIAHGLATYWLGQSNRHLAQAFIAVAPEQRRRGLGRSLLARLLADTRREQRRLILFNERSSVKAAGAALARYGATVGLENRLSRLDLERLAPSVLADFHRKAAERAQEFTLGSWVGPYPEAELVAIAELMQVMNSAPRGSLDVEDGHITPDQLRAGERALAASETERWSLYARERAGGRLAGLTSLTWNPSRPILAQQQETLVRPEYRNHGIGRWLKAAMLEKLGRDRPEVRWIETVNAKTNAAMLKINLELGFQPYQSVRNWQLTVERAEAYLRQCDGRC